MDKPHVRFEDTKPKRLLFGKTEIAVWFSAQTSELSSVRRMIFACRANRDTQSRAAFGHLCG